MIYNNINSAYPMVKIGEAADVFSGFGFKSKDFSNEGIPVIKIKNVNNRVVNLDEVQYYPREKLTERMSKSKLMNKDVLIAMTGQGSVGRVGRLILRDNQEVLLNQRVGKFVTDNKQLDLDFLYYILSSKRYEQVLFDAGTGSGQPNLSPKVIKSIEIPFPDIKIQKRIANLLNTQDEKIRINNDMISNLEELAQTLFKRWFVDFEFPNENGEPYRSGGGKMVESELGMIPEGWWCESLKNIANHSKKTFNPKKEKDTFVNHFSIPNFDSVLFPTIDMTMKIKSDKYVIDSFSLLFSKMNPSTPRIWLPCVSDEITNVCSTEFVVLDTSIENNKAFVYSLIKSRGFTDFLISNTTGSTNSRQRVNSKVATSYKFACNNKITDIYNKKMNPIILKNTSLRNEIQYLKKLRDTLLPKLLSGEMELPDENEVTDNVPIS